MADNQTFTRDPTEGMNFLQRAAAGYAKTVLVDPYNRARQALGYASQPEIDEQARLAAPLMHTAGGLTGAGVGEIAKSIPLAGGLGLAAKSIPWLARAATAMPRLFNVGSAAVQGGAQGAMQPVTSGQTAAGNVEGGALAGGLGQTAAEGAAALARPAAAAAKPYIAALAQKAKDFNIPLSAAQVSGSRLGQFVRNTFGEMPFGGSNKLGENQMSQFTKKVTGTFGPEADNAIKAVGQAKDDLGTGFNTISARNKMYLSQGHFDQLDAIPLEHVAGGGDAAEATRLQAMVNNIKKQYADNGGEMPGTQYQSMRSNLGRKEASAASNPDLQDQWGAIKSVLDDGMQRSLFGTPDADAWQALRQKYANMKTVERALPTSGENATSGFVNPEKLSSVMSAPGPKNEFNRSNMQQPVGAGSDLADIAQVGNAFVPKAATEGGFHFPGASALKSLGRSAPSFGTAAAMGFGAAHLMPEDSELAKHPLVAAGLAGLGGLVGGATLGQAANSRWLLEGSPRVAAALEAARKAGIPAAAAYGTLNLANAAHPSLGQSAGTPSNQSNPFEGMEEVPSSAMEPAAPSGKGDFSGMQEVQMPGQK